jgi:glycerol-3-phosphate cytidylyltransferase
MKKTPVEGITFGVFDIFHIGHLNMLENAKKYCDYLTVAVHHDKLNVKNVEFLYSLEDRIRIVEAIKFVDKAIVYERVDLTLNDIEFDIFIYGPDQNHQYFQRAFQICKERNKKMIEVNRTPGISSSILRNISNKKEI